MRLECLQVGVSRLSVPGVRFADRERQNVVASARSRATANQRAKRLLAGSFLKLAPLR